MMNSNGPVIVNYVSFESGQTSYSVGSVEPKRAMPNQPPIIAVHHIHGPSGPGPEDYNFSSVQTLELLEMLDSRNDFSGYAEKHWPCVGCFV